MKIEEAFARLKKSVEASRLAHAYIIEGELRGEAQQLAGRILELLFCEAEKKPCGVCKSCRQTKQRAHPDALWVEPQKKSRLISVEQARNLQQLIYQTAYAGGWKACVIVGADRLGSEAANAILKTLEEPPKQSVFFLLTDSPDSLPPTVISRCQRISLSGGEPDLPEKWLEALDRILTDKTRKNAITTFAKAELAQRLFKDMKTAAKKVENERAETSAQEDEEETIDARAEALYREWRKALLRRMLHWHRDILLLASGSDEKLLFNKARRDVLAEKAKGLSVGKALRNLNVVEEINRQLESNLPEGAVLSFGFSRLS